jgi:hypothetical protein
MARVVRLRFFLLFHSIPSTDLNLHVGAIYALASFFAFAAPNARFLVFFVVPMRAWACIGAVACFDAYNAVTRRVRRSFIFFGLLRRKFFHHPTTSSLKPFFIHSSLLWTPRDTLAD